MARTEKTTAVKTSSRPDKSPFVATDQQLLSDIRSLIESAREQTARAVNSALVGLYWHIGKWIREDVLREKRAEYGEKVVQTLSAQLSAEYGRGYTEKGLRRILQFAERFSDREIVATLSRQLSWSHFIVLIPISDPLKRDFYAEICRIERWSTRTLRHKIDHLLYERTAVSKKPDELIVEDLAALRDDDRMTPDMIFRDPYFLDFLGLARPRVEKDLEQAILRELEAFIMELGTDFSFVARQKRITVDQEDYYLDLLFYHRRLRRLVAVELKLGKFEASDKGQMELYLRWLERHETRKGEEPPIGLILCADKSEEHVELLQLDQSGIRVAQYLTDLPPRELLEKKLHDSIRLAKEQMAIAASDEAAGAAPEAKTPPANDRLVGPRAKAGQIARNRAAFHEKPNTGCGT